MLIFVVLSTNTQIIFEYVFLRHIFDKLIRFVKRWLKNKAIDSKIVYK